MNLATRKMEFLCPHCLATNSCKDNEHQMKNNQPSKVRCTSCFTPFEIIVATELNGRHNVIVNDLSN